MSNLRSSAVSGAPPADAPERRTRPRSALAALRARAGLSLPTHPTGTDAAMEHAGGTSLSDRYRRETRLGQLEETLELTNHLAITHMIIAGAVLYFFWGIGPTVYLVTLYALVVLPVVLIAAGTRLYRSRPNTPALVERGHRAMEILWLILGLAWGSMPVALFPSSDSDHRMLVVALCAGLIASAYAIGPIPVLSLLFAIPIVLGSFLGLGLSGEHIAGILAVFLGVYAAFVLFSVRRMTRLSTQRILDRVRMSEQSETIGLLLNDFEENTSDWLWETDRSGALQHVSERIAQVSGRSMAELKHAPFETLFSGDQGDGRWGDGVAELVALVRERTAFRDHIVEVASTGSLRWWRLSGKPIYDKAESFIGFRGVGADITETRHSEARIAYLASYDSLTGLANRALFHQRATAECEQAARQGRPCALLYMDLDGFKIVNDTFGHGFGDILLKRVAARLLAGTREGTLVSRLGGDEFAVLQACDEVADAARLARALIAAISAPYTIDGVQIEIGVSIGIAMAPSDAQEPESLLGKADLALYRAKAEGKGALFVFEPGLEIAVRTRRELETDLKLAIAHGEFELHYQPLVGLADGRVNAFEALLRWSNATRGFISPADFVPVAEATGLISEIGRWVLHQACAEAARWPRDIRIAVNLSPTQFRTSDLVGDVVGALTSSGLDPDRLELEITESVFFEMNATTISNLRDLRALGIRIALDDFGTGYSSLSYLIRFPVDKIKIDRSFIKDMGTRHECLAIIEAILALAKKLSMTVTAEGVEGVEQALMLKASGCDDIQGFLFSPARPAAEVAGLIATLPHRFDGIFPAARDEPALPLLRKACA